MASSISLVIASLFKSQGLNQARQALVGAQRDFGSLASSIGQAAGAFGAFQAITSSRQFMIDSVDTAQRFERNVLALKQVFEEASPALRNFTEQVESYGLSQAQAAQASVFIGSVLKQYGYSVNEAAGETQKLVMLAQDLATTYGYDVQEALLAITALFRGEFDPIEKFGVAMKQSEINARLAADGLGDLEGEALNYASAQTRLTMLFERAGDSVGAFTRASDTLYGSQQRLNAEIGNLQIAFGSELQAPLAAVINYFAELVDKYGPEVVEIGRAIGGAVEDATPLIMRLGDTLGNLIALLQPVVELIGGLTNALSLVLNPALDIVNGTLSGIVQFFDTWSATIEAATIQVSRLTIALNENPLFKATTGALFGRAAEGIELVGNAFTFLNEQMVRNEQNARAVTGEFSGFDNGAKRASVSLRASGLAARDAADNIEVAAEATNYFEDALRAMGLQTEDAEGQLSGLALIFSEIDEAARKSGAKASLDEIGFSAAQIEAILTRPDWAKIFGEISRLARLAAMDINKVSYAGAIAISNAQVALAELLGGYPSGGGGGGKTDPAPVRNKVKEFLTDLADEIAKQTARGRLEGLGIASEGLLNEIFGSDGWEEIYKRILKGGTNYLKGLQTQYEKTADGLKEINDQMEAEEERRQEENEKELRALEELRQKQEEYNEMVRERIAAMREFRTAIESISLLDVLDDNEREIGRYEASVAGFFENILNNLKDAFDNELILESSYRELVAYANAERSVLEQIQRQRDEVAERINLSEALIREYTNAFTASANLVSLLGQIESKTKKVTVTEFTEGMVTLNDSLKEFKVTLTRSFEEAQTETVDKTAKLIGDFRNIAEKARTFAQNLRTLRDMGLDPMLFNQLVEAGVEAGGETAQALVDGGSETISEVNTLFGEINALGADLGEEVASTMYGAGVDMSNGLIAGLKAMQDQLKQQAEDMAKSFADAFMAAIDAAIAEAMAKLKALEDAARNINWGNYMGQNMSGVVQGNSPIGGDYIVGFLPIAPSPVVPTQPSITVGTGNVNIYADTRYGGYQAATAFTATQSRLATNNAGISSFMKIG